MSVPELEMEICYKIWNNTTGSRIEVQPDADGLDMVEIKLVDEAGKEYNRVVIDLDTAQLLSAAILNVWNDIKMKPPNA